MGWDYVLGMHQKRWLKNCLTKVDCKLSGAANTVLLVDLLIQLYPMPRDQILQVREEEEVSEPYLNPPENVVDWDNQQSCRQ